LFGRAQEGKVDGRGRNSKEAGLSKVVKRHEVGGKEDEMDV